jgi:hypothetical protein
VRWLTSTAERASDIAAVEEVRLRVIPTRVHAVFDYAVGALLIAAPWLFDFARGRAEMWIPLLLGAATTGYSLLTDYELGMVRRLPMPLHLMLDVMGGVLLVVSPWLFGFAAEVWAPHLIIGVIAIGVALTTWRTPAYSATAVPADAWLYEGLVTLPPVFPGPVCNAP